MDTEPKVYTEEEILALASAINQNIESFKWLFAHCKELAAVADALAFKTKKAEAWLERNGYKLLSEFINALDYDANPAYEFLDSYPRKEWAAVVDAVNDNDDKAILWLFKSNLKYFAALATTLRERAKHQPESNDGNAGFAAILAIGLVGGIIGEATAGAVEGFGGFGGGGFGGAGAGGAW